MTKFGGKPSGKERPSPSRLKFWRALKLQQLWKALTEAPDTPQGTPQKKVRWRRSEQLGQARRKRAKRRRARTAITKRLQRSRRLKGQNARTGGHCR